LRTYSPQECPPPAPPPEPAPAPGVLPVDALDALAAFFADTAPSGHIPLESATESVPRIARECFETRSNPANQPVAPRLPGRQKAAESTREKKGEDMWGDASEETVQVRKLRTRFKPILCQIEDNDMSEMQKRTLAAPKWPEGKGVMLILYVSSGDPFPYFLSCFVARPLNTGMTRGILSDGLCRVLVFTFQSGKGGEVETLFHFLARLIKRLRITSLISGHV
jgi:hypothetical protein